MTRMPVIAAHEFTRALPMGEDPYLFDTHPDPLWVSSAYLYPQPGWLFLVVYGPTMDNGTLTLRSEPGMDAYASTHRHIPVPVMLTDQYTVTDAPWAALSSVYSHPSDEWIREVARQYISGERVISRRSLSFYEHDDELGVCAVEIRRAGERSSPGSDTGTLVQEIRTPDCPACTPHRGDRW